MKKNNNNKQKGDSSVKVIVRVRPTLSIEAGTENVVSIGPDVPNLPFRTNQSPSKPMNTTRSKPSLIWPSVERRTRRKYFRAWRPRLDN